MDCPSVFCYPTPGKIKADMICAAFAQGAGGVRTDPRQGLQPGPAFFYGVTEATMAVWKRAVDEGQDWFYCDNSYFDRGRQASFRVTKNAFQLSALAVPSFKRLDAVGVRMQPWKTPADGHIVVCEQSREFMHLSGFGSGWLEWVERQLDKATARKVVVRRWNRDKKKMADTLNEALEGAWALVTHMSAAANQALIAGIPVFTTGGCAASPLAGGVLSSIESPVYPNDREAWAAGLANNQWTVEEMRDGTCWRALQSGETVWK